MDSAESSIKTWLKFFTDAGIPAGVATEYAISFSDNRMRLDMLPELTRDYLRDLSVTMLGDVITILKHAKSVSRQEYKARKMDSRGVVTPSPSPPPAGSAVKRPPAPVPGESPASRMVKRLVRKEPVTPSPPAAARLKREADSLQDDLDDGPAGPKRRLVTSGRLGTPQTQTVSPGSRKTVFDRLGGGGGGTNPESQVSSTTPDSSTATQFRITGLSGPAPAQRSPLHAEAAPPAARQRVTFVSESVRLSPPRCPAGGLGYRGVLKPGAAAAQRTVTGTTTQMARKVPPRAAVTGTLASDREGVLVSARSRIGVPAGRGGAATPVRTRLSRPTATGSAVKTRLGVAGGSVRSRLGTAEP